MLGRLDGQPQPRQSWTVKPSHTALACLVGVIWGVNFVFIDLGLRDTLPLLLVALRFLLVAIPLVFFVRRPDVPWRIIIGVGLFMSAGQFGCVFTAIHLGLPAGLAAAVLQSQMIFTVLISAVVVRERPTAKQITGIAVGAGGLALVAAGRFGGVEGAAAVLPFVICLAGGLSWGIGNVIARLAPPSNGLGLVVWSALVVPIPMVALSLILDGPAAVAESVTSFGWETWACVAYTAIAASLVRYPSAAVAPFSLLAPVVALAAGVLILHELPNAVELFGAAVLIIGVAVIAVPRWRARRTMTSALR